MKLIVFALLMSSLASARTEQFTGDARTDGKLVYIEKHKVEYADDGKIEKSETRYESPDGKLLAQLKSDFTKSVAVPDHEIEDTQTGEVEGLRREGDKIVLFDHEKDKPEKKRVLDEHDAAKRILVGCQGLNYYVLGNLETMKSGTVVPLRFLIPGKLDYYDFDMHEVANSDPKKAEFEIKINSWVLRMFVPKLKAVYDRKTKKILHYEGISNIKTENGENQKVSIDYHYEEPNSDK